MIKKIGILTSGGDAPGMNNAIRAVGRAALASGLEVAIIYDGYKGLVNGDIKNANHQTFSDVLNSGGTFLRSARLPEFADVEIRAKGIAKLKENNIDALVVIGGDGSYMGALRLTEEGINCIGLPGTIDNDISTSDYTIGFDTALNTIVDLVDKIRDTSRSHSRCTIVEIMGRHCGDLTLYASIATGADVVSLPEKFLSEEEIVNILKTQQNHKRNPIVLVTENQFDVNKLAKKIEEETGFITRAVVPAHIQRGGRPSAFDRVLASRLGVKAVELLKENKGGIELGIINNQIIANPIGKNKDKNHPLIDELYQVNKKIV